MHFQKRTILSAVLASLIPMVLFGSCTGEADPSHTRTVATANWDTLFVLGEENPNDTLFAAPYLMTIWEDNLTVADDILSLVRVFDMNGDLRWSFGRKGQGPGEFAGISSLAVSPKGNLWIWDYRNQRVSELSTSGELIREITARSLPHPAHRLVSNAGRVFFVQNNPSHGIMEVDPETFELISVQPLPWPGALSEDLNLQLNVAVDPLGITDLWVAGFLHGPGFMVFSGEVPKTYMFIDSVPFAHKAGPMVRGTPLDSARFAAVSAAISQNEVHFLFGGRPHRMVHPGEPTMFIDSYDLEGNYRRSFLLPFPGFQLVSRGDVYFVSRIEPFPQVLALRPMM